MLSAAAHAQSAGWAPVPTTPHLAADEVHVWRATVPGADCAPDVLADLARTLSAEEAARAARHRFARDRARFIVAHGVLRSLAGRYTGVEPDRLAFSRGCRGKPALRDGTAELTFNLSHSGELVLVAFGRAREVGVDVELRRDDLAYEPILAQFFSQYDVRALRAVPREARRDAFFECWTRKEALIKAWGAGLDALGTFGVPVEPGAPLVVTDPWPSGDAPPGAWSVHALAPGAGYAGAVAARGEGWRVRCWEWSP